MKMMGSMACAGSLVVFLYLIFKSVLKEFFGAKYRYGILLMALFFYLVPFQLGHYLYRASDHASFTDQKGRKAYDMTGKFIEVNWEGRIYVPFGAVSAVLFAIWSITAATVLFIGLSAYRKQRRMFSETGEDITDGGTLAVLESVRTGLGIRRKVKYRWNPELEVPLSMGIFHPLLLLPKRWYPAVESRLIYSHELLHIKNYDTLFKLLGMLAIGFNWYNPFVYWWYRELCKVSESLCDEKIALGCGQEQRKKYAYLILEMATEGKKSSLTYAAPFGSSRENVMERITLMMKTRKLHVGMRILAIGLTAVIGLTGSIPVLAYKKPVMVQDESRAIVEHDMLAEEVFVEEGFQAQEDQMNKLFMDADKANIKELPAERYFEDLEGNIYIDEERVEQRACSHTYVSGTQKEHKKSEDGCTVYVYNARKCTGCGHVQKDSLAYQLSYPQCPH